MSRGYSGTAPKAPTLADESYLDFVKTFRGRVAFRHMQEADRERNDYMSDRLNGRDIDEIEIDEIATTLNELPYVRVWQRMMRSHQEMFWRRTQNAFEKEQDVYLAELEAADKCGPGKLVIDPNFEPPEYTRHEIHLQPGGYTDNPIGGFVFHCGGKVFYYGTNDNNELPKELAATTFAPADGKVERVIDVGCSLGQATIELKDRFPDAEIWGLDVGAPMVRYAHMQSVKQNVDVNFIQALAEDTGFPDDHFDAALIFILFHEVPFAKTQEILKEVYRIMRPGGVVTILEFPNNGGDLDVSRKFIVDYDSRNNCEPYSPGLVYGDFHGAIRDAGFEIGPGPKNSNAFLQTLTATKPE